ncbi:hypothetical protein HID58_059482 [Brassica napus]|uniref:Uncharacterized protein n=1 Tax=Brassica napus TaxID=3708 RepID=A0ABQ7ZTT1_BRANA|nr:hypothetical protein HID58_059482 [Brassica napus]
MKMFFALSPYFKLEPSPSMYFVTFLVCGASHHHRKKTHIFLLFFLPSSPMRLYDRVYEFSVVRLLPTALFQLMLGSASHWLGHSLFVFDFVFLVVGLPSIVSARFGFQDLLSSHLWWLSLSPCLPLEIWIMFSFVYAMWAWKVISGLKCAELVSWSFGPFYPELCDFSVGCRLRPISNVDVDDLQVILPITDSTKTIRLDIDLIITSLERTNRPPIKEEEKLYMHGMLRKFQQWNLSMLSYLLSYFPLPLH